MENIRKQLLHLKFIMQKDTRFQELIQFVYDIAEYVETNIDDIKEIK